MKVNWGEVWKALQNYAQRLRDGDDWEGLRICDARAAYETALQEFPTDLVGWKQQTNRRIHDGPTPKRRSRLESVQ